VRLEGEGGLNKDNVVFLQRKKCFIILI
jgi:hypothetical protein